MNRQSDSEYTENRDIVSDSHKECIRLEGERIPVKKDDKTINDDIGDYVFTEPRKKKKRKVKAHKKNSAHDFPIVKSDRGYRRKKKKMKIWKKVLIGIGCSLLSLVLIVVGVFYALLYKGSKQLYDNDYIVTAPQGVEVQDSGKYVIYNGNQYELNKNITSILFIGVDKRNLDETGANGTGGQADVVVLAAVDTETGKVSLINVSRDTITDVARYSAGGSYVGMEEEQLCLAYAYGDGKKTSCENTVSSVERLFYNIPVKSYYSLDLDGIASVNDSIGGVDVTSPETIQNFVAGESYHLEGDMAESFVRARDTAVLESNNSRIERQMVYVNAFMNKVIGQIKQDVSTPLDLFNAASPYSCTNLNASKVCYLAEEMVTGSGVSTQILSVPGEVKMGEKYAEFYVNEDEFYELFLSVFYNKVS